MLILLGRPLTITEDCWMPAALVISTICDWGER